MVGDAVVKIKKAGAYDAYCRVNTRGAREGFVVHNRWYCVKQSFRDRRWYGSPTVTYESEWFGPGFDTPEECALWLEMQA